MDQIHNYGVFMAFYGVFNLYWGFSFTPNPVEGHIYLKEINFGECKNFGNFAINGLFKIRF